MPVFAFDEPQQKTTSASIRVGDEDPITNVDQLAVCDTTIPSRSTKPFDRDLLIFLLILLPVVVAAIQFCFNPRVRSFFCARAAQVLQQPHAAIGFYSDALNQERDALTLLYRADAYKAVDDPLHQRNDLMDSIALNPEQDSIYLTAAGLHVRCGNPELAAPLLKRYANLPPRAFSGESWARWRNKQAAYNLLLLGDAKAATELANLLPNSDEDKTVITALLARQEMNPKRSRDILSALNDSDEPNLYKDSRTSYREVITKDSIDALLALDEKKLDAARKELTRLLQVTSNGKHKDDVETPVVDVLQGWLLLEEGQIDDCLKLSAKLVETKELKDSLEGLNIKAALHLMRYRAFQKQDNPTAALAEERLYKDSHSSGHLFAPLWAWKD